MLTREIDLESSIVGAKQESVVNTIERHASATWQVVALSRFAELAEDLTGDRAAAHNHSADGFVAY